LQLFLARLATDPTTYKEYLKNPNEVMHQAGLSAADQAALRSGDPAIIAAQLEAGAHPGPGRRPSRRASRWSPCR
jgi:hypothetical protein